MSIGSGSSFTLNDLAGFGDLRRKSSYKIPSWATATRCWAHADVSSARDMRESIARSIGDRLTGNPTA